MLFDCCFKTSFSTIYVVQSMVFPIKSSVPIDAGFSKSRRPPVPTECSDSGSQNQRPVTTSTDQDRAQGKRTTETRQNIIEGGALNSSSQEIRFRFLSFLYATIQCAAITYTCTQDHHPTVRLYWNHEQGEPRYGLFVWRKQGSREASVTPTHKKQKRPRSLATALQRSLFESQRFA